MTKKTSYTLEEIETVVGFLEKYSDQVEANLNPNWLKPRQAFTSLFFLAFIRQMELNLRRQYRQQQSEAKK